MLSTFIIIVAWLSIFHFVYEGILAPAGRLKLRNRLFVVRDDLRQAKIDGIAEVDREAFWIVHDGVNSFLPRLATLTITNQVAAVEAYRRDASLRDQVNRRVATVDRCSDDRLRAARKETVLIVQEAGYCNSASWFVYVLPLAFTLVMYRRLKRLATSLVFTPESRTSAVLGVPPDPVPA